MFTQPRVLIVESDADDLFLIRRGFAKACPGSEVFSVATAEEAIRYLVGDEPYTNRKEHPLPTLLLVDLKMQGMGGFDLLEWLKTKPDLTAIAIVVLTGSGMPADLQKALDLGADDYYVKPHEYAEMENIVRELAARSLPANLPPTE
jgi:CheY-like chemotaxis protein